MKQTPIDRCNQVIAMVYCLPWQSQKSLQVYPGWIEPGLVPIQLYATEDSKLYI